MPNYTLNFEPPAFSSPAEPDSAVVAKLNQHTNILGGVVRFGRVVKPSAEEEAAAPKDIPRVLVQVGEREGNSTRNWMPWTNSRAGGDGEWWAPEEEEQVLVVAPSGNLVLGIIVGSLNSKKLNFISNNNAESNASDSIPSDIATLIAEKGNDVHTRIYKDGTSITYDRDSHRFDLELRKTPDAEASVKLSCTAEQSISLSAGKTHITINKDGAVEIMADKNNITIVGNVQVQGKLDVLG